MLLILIKSEQIICDSREKRAVFIEFWISQAAEKGADAIINVRYMTTSVVGSAAELLAYGTAVKFSE